jgi:hypothetical protein
MTTTAAHRSLPGFAVATAIGLIACALALTACTGGAAPSTAPSADPTASPPPGTTPADSVEPGGGAAGGGAAGDPGTGVGVVPVDPTPVGPDAGEPQLVRAIPGRANPHQVAPIKLETSVDGRHALVRITWYGGVEPCHALDSVRIERTGLEIAVTPIEGSNDPNAMCIEIAVLKATIVDLGDLEPGTWRISSPGSEVPPVVITID